MLPRLVAAGAALTVAALGILTGPAASADVNDFEFESMHVDFTLDRDADGTSRLHAVETLVAVFPDFDQNRGIIRDLPTRERVDGFGQVDRGLTVVSVTDENGDPVPFERSTWSDDAGTEFVSLALGTDDYVQGRTTYVIEWAARDVVLPFADTGSDEFYWDVNGTGWAQPFGSVTADVRLGEGLEAALTGAAACYAGAAGSTAGCDLVRDGDGFAMDAGALGPYQNATMAIGFEPGTFRSPTPLEQSWPVTVLPWVLLGILAVAAVLAAVFRRVLWVDAPGRGIIIPKYEGPDELGVMAAANLVGRPGAALPAQFVRLATEGVARLVEDPDAPENRRFTLELVDAASAQGADAVAVKKLFGAKKAVDGATLVLDRSNRKLGDRVASLTAQAAGEVTSKGYRAQGPKSPLSRLILWPALVVVLGSIGLAIWCGAMNVGSPLLTVQIVVGIVGGILVMGFSGKPVRRTAKGTAAYEQLLGLRDYLRLAEADRLRVLQSPEGAVRERIDPGDARAVVRLYERLLPWAIVWGVEKEWADVLAAHYDETVPPSSNLGLASGIVAVSTLGRSYSSSSFATTPTPSSSGSGGSSFSGGSFGGGFSGGGGGGGGGGGR